MARLRCRITSPIGESWINGVYHAADSWSSCRSYEFTVLLYLAITRAVRKAIRSLLGICLLNSRCLLRLAELMVPVERCLYVIRCRKLLPTSDGSYFETREWLANELLHLSSDEETQYSSCSLASASLSLDAISLIWVNYMLVRLRKFFGSNVN